jgi:hypothetical protein
MSMNIKRHFTIIFFSLIRIIFSGNIAAQENYLPGYIINTHKDTVQGLIDYRNWERNPDIISFKSGSEDAEKYYLPTGIREFVVADEIYVSAIVDKMDLENFSGLLQYDASIKLKKDTVFLQTLVSGGKDLYYLKDKDGVEQYYIHSDTSYQLLKYKKYLKEKDGGISYVENKSYIGQLVLAFQDCSGIQDKVKDLDYSKTDLVKLFLDYHQCTHQTVRFEKKKEHLDTQIGCLLGITYTTVEANSSTNYLKDVPLDASTNLSAGISFNFVLARNLGKWSIAEELLYTSYSTGGHYDDALNPATIEISVSQIKLNNMVRYKTPMGKFFVFANPGISLGIGVHSTNIRHDESIFHPPMDAPAVYSFRSSEVGFLLGAGVGYKAFSLHLRYEISSGFSATDGLATPTKRLYVLAGYTF